MIQNEAIRQEVIELLKGNIAGIEHFHNGRAVFTDTNSELPAIAVFIDEAAYQPSVFVSGMSNDSDVIFADECDAQLKIAIYVPVTASESKLDIIAQQVAMAMKEAKLESVDECSFGCYTYDYDESATVWKKATLHFLVNYLN